MTAVLFQAVILLLLTRCLLFFIFYVYVSVCLCVCVCVCVGGGVDPIVCGGSVLSVLSTLTIILMRKRELVALN